MFFRWLQDEDYMKNFGAIIGSFTGFIIGLLLSIAIGLAVVPTTTTKIKYYIDDNKLYYVGEDGTMEILKRVIKLILRKDIIK